MAPPVNWTEFAEPRAKQRRQRSKQRMACLAFEGRPYVMKSSWSDFSDQHFWPTHGEADRSVWVLDPSERLRKRNQHFHVAPPLVLSASDEVSTLISIGSHLFIPSLSSYLEGYGESREPESLPRLFLASTYFYYGQGESHQAWASPTALSLADAMTAGGQLEPYWHGERGFLQPQAIHEQQQRVRCGLGASLITFYAVSASCAASAFFWSLRTLADGLYGTSSLLSVPEASFAVLAAAGILGEIGLGLLADLGFYDGD